MSARVPPRRRRLASGPSPLNDAEAGNIAAKGELSARENRVWMPVRQIVQAQLSRGSNFVAMLGHDRDRREINGRARFRTVLRQQRDLHLRLPRFGVARG
jgi:hypothetical protein